MGSHSNSKNQCTVGAIDIGSNAIRLSIAEKDNEGRVKRVHSRREALRLGKESFSQGYFSPQTEEVFLHIMGKFKETIDQFQVSQVRAVATSACRCSDNGLSLIKKANELYQLNIELIDGEEEAQLIRKAVSQFVPLKNFTGLLFDVGGGSTELTKIVKGETVVTKSLQIGTVRMMNEAQFEDVIEAHLDHLKAILFNQSLETIVGTGGNIERIGKLKVQLFNKANNSLVNRDDFFKISLHVLGLSVDERIQSLKMRKDRADVIAVALKICEVLFNNTQAKHLVIPQVGLKDGVILSLLENV